MLIVKPEKDGKTPLMQIRKNSQIEMFRLLINSKAKINEKDNDGWNALMHACRGASSENDQIVRELLAIGANVNEKGKDGKSPLSIACLWYSAGSKIVYMLIENWANLDERNEDGFTIIQQQFLARKETLVKELARCGADILQCTELSLMKSRQRR